MNYWQEKLRDAERERDAARRELEDVLALRGGCHAFGCNCSDTDEENDPYQCCTLPPESGAYDDGYEAGYEVGYGDGYRAGFDLIRTSISILSHKQ